MADISSLIKQFATEAVAGKIEIPENIKDKVLGGISDSIFDSVKQTAQKSGGIQQITELVTGATSASSSPITTLASKIFQSGVAEKLGLSPAVTSAITTMLPTIIDKLKDLDLDEVILAVGKSDAAQGALKKVATSIFGKLFGK